MENKQIVDSRPGPRQQTFMEDVLTVLVILCLLGLALWWIIVSFGHTITIWWDGHWGWVAGFGGVIGLGCASPVIYKVLKVISGDVQTFRMREEEIKLIASVGVNSQRGYNTKYANALQGISFESINPETVKPVSRVTTNNYLAGPEEEFVEEEETREPLMFKLIDQIRDHDTQPYEQESVIGYTGEDMLTGPLFEVEGNVLDSVFCAGDQGQGKSSFAVYMAGLTVYHGGRLLVIDPDAEIKQSLTNRLGPLKDFVLCPIADTPEKAERVLQMANAEMQNPSDYSVLLLVDEFSMIMRHGASGVGVWKDVAKAIASTVEDYGTRGRKRRRRAIVMGQITNAKRSGGTELRDSLTTICFKLKKQRAQRVLEPEDAEIAPTLLPGEVLVIPARSSEDSYVIQVPYPDPDGLQVIADAMMENGSDWHDAPAEELPSQQSTNVSRGPITGKLGNMRFPDLFPSLETALEADEDMPDEMSVSVSEESPLERRFDKLNTVSDEKRETIRRLYRTNMPHRQIAKAVGLAGRKYDLYQQVCREMGIETREG